MYNAVVLDIRDHRSRSSPEYFHTRQQDRLEYMLLKRKRVGRRCGVRMIVAMVCTESSVGTIRADLGSWSIGLT